MLIYRKHNNKISLEVATNKKPVLVTDLFFINNRQVSCLLHLLILLSSTSAFSNLVFLLVVYLRLYIEKTITLLTITMIEKRIIIYYLAIL